jgi:hypothetical protein
MKRILALTLVALAVALTTVGCGSKSAPGVAAKPAGKPSSDEATAALAEHLGSIGCEQVAVSGLADKPDAPNDVLLSGEYWAYQFTAAFSNMLGERMTSDRWIACLARNDDGKVVVKMCRDERPALAENTPAIVAPTVPPVPDVSPIKPVSFTDPAKDK